MPFIAPAIVGAVGLAGTTAGAVLGGLINVGIAGGLAFASSALTGKTGTTAQTGVQTDLRMGGGVARGGSFGRVGTAGFLAYSNSFADNLNMLDLVQVLGDGPHDGLDGVWVAGTRHAVTRIGGNAWRTDYRVDGVIGATGISYLTVVLWHGYSDQPASNVLVNYANPAGRWTAQDRLAGVCYAHVSGLYDEEAFPDGVPQCVFDLRGRRLYDWRKDSTVGGSGPHRWSDEKTWEFSENPFVQLYNYQRGTWLGGELTVGMGVAPVDLNPDAWTAAANACDELVAESDGSTAPRYRCGTYVAADEEHAAVIQRFLDACGGALYESVGAYSPQAGVAQVVTYPTITDGDLVSGRPVRFAARRPRAELTNGVFGSFSDPKQQYELMAYAARTSAAAEAADGEIIRVQVDYPSVHYGLQAQRLAQMQLGLARFQGTATITLGFSAVVLEPGDWVRWNSARYGLRTWMIAGLTQHADQTVTLTLREIGAAAYAWTEADEGTVSAGGVPGDRPALITTVPLMSVAATSLVGNDGNRQPALRITWAPILDGTVDSIQIAYRIKGGAGAALSASSAAPNSGELLISAGVQGKTVYEVQGTITTTPKRGTVWTAWAEVTTGDLTATPGAGVIIAEMFTAGLKARVLDALDDGVTARQELDERLTGITDDLAAAVGELDGALDGVASGMGVLQGVIDATSKGAAQTAAQLARVTGDLGAELERVGWALADVRAAAGNADRDTRKALATTNERLLSEVGTSRALISAIQIAYADADAALARRIDLTEASYAAALARIIGIEEVQATDREAAARVMEGLSTRLDAAAVDLTREAQARSDADGALGSRLDSMAAATDAGLASAAAETRTASGDLRDELERIGWALADVRAAAGIADRAVRGALVTTNERLLAEAGSSRALISAMELAYADADKALALRLDEVRAATESNDAAIRGERQTRTTALEAMTLRIDAQESVSSGHAAAINGINTTLTGPGNSIASQINEVRASAVAAGGLAGEAIEAAAAADGRAGNAAAAAAAADDKAGGAQGTATDALTRANSNTSAITAESAARATAVASLALRSNALEAAVGQRPDGSLVSVSGTYATQEALATAQSAMASDVDEVAAELAGVKSRSNVRAVAAVAPDGATAALEMAVDVTAGGESVRAGLTIGVWGGPGGYAGGVLIEADKFYVRSGGNIVPAFGITGGDVFIRNNLIAGNSITADQINARVFNYFKMNSPTGKLDIDGEVGRILCRD